MASDPELRMQILSKVQETGMVRAATLAELKECFGMSEVSNTQFGKALRSLYYKYRQLRVNRPHAERPYYGPRIYEVSYTPKEIRTVHSTVAVV